jgi:ketosteroid isomerase-like protein
MNKGAVKNEVWGTVQALNRLWTVEDKPDRLGKYFHERMIAVTPTDRLRREGSEACVAGWKAFTDHAKIHYWKEIDPLIEVYGEGRFAVAAYYFEMSVEMGGQTFKLEGRDMFSLVKEDGKWQVVSDQFSPYPQG